jgi:5-methylcytosine-specific restriction endonuclease McrA
MTKTELYRKLRLILINQMGGKCQGCAKDLTQTIPIAHIHHKDSNHENDSKENIQLLCQNCHRKVHSSSGADSEELGDNTREFIFENPNDPGQPQQGVYEWYILHKG